MILALSFRIPPPFVTEEHDSISIIQEHLRRAARVVAGLGVLEGHTNVANPFPNAAEPPRLPASFVVEGGGHVPCAVRQRRQLPHTELPLGRTEPER